MIVIPLLALMLPLGCLGMGRDILRGLETRGRSISSARTVGGSPLWADLRRWRYRGGVVAELWRGFRNLSVSASVDVLKPKDPSNGYADQYGLHQD